MSSSTNVSLDIGQIVWLLEMSLNATTVVAAVICSLVGRIVIGSKKLTGMVVERGGNGGGGGGGGGVVKGGGLDSVLR